VFQNPVGFGTRPAFFQAKACGLKSGETAFLSGSCSETEVSEQLDYNGPRIANRWFDTD
jgi:hypothetical protein